MKRRVFNPPDINVVPIRVTPREFDMNDWEYESVKGNPGGMIYMKAVVGSYQRFMHNLNAHKKFNA